MCVEKKRIHISDRKFFNYTPIVQAAAYIRESDTVSVEDLMILKNYFWTTPSEIETISDVLKEICDNPIKKRIDDLLQWLMRHLKTLWQTVRIIVRLERCVMNL